MNFEELNNIAKVNKLNNPLTYSQDSFELAKSLSIRLKNSMECKQDFPDKNQLRNNNAVYALFKGEFTIYYDEKYAYRNFAIAHEVAHHILQHESDGAVQHHDANILAAILIAPKESILENRIKNEIELSEKYVIPIEVAQLYWKYLNINNPKVYQVYISLTILLVIGIIIFALTRHYIPPAANNIPPQKEENIAISTQSQQEAVYVTVSGSKYHLPDCSYVKNKNNLTQYNLDEAIEQGYRACSRCF